MSLLLSLISRAPMIALFLIIAFLGLTIAIAFVAKRSRNQPPPALNDKDIDQPIAQQIPEKIPLSVNYHFLRTCNYACKFCFHTELNSVVLPLDKALDGLQALKSAGMKKINFSGGEPFLKADMLGKMVRFCKATLGLESVTVVSNGSLIKEEWFQKYGAFLDIIAISCDSFVEETNVKIGRTSRARRPNALSHIQKMEQIRDWCIRYDVVFKINSVINNHNVDEDMTVPILRLKPKRWKVFQCLLIDGENAGPDALRNAQDLVITSEQYQQFINRHSSVRAHGVDLREEPNDIMRNSYLILDEQMRFLDCSQGKKTPSPSILDVGVAGAMNTANFDEESFLQRGGVFEWSKPKAQNYALPPELEW